MSAILSLCHRVLLLESGRLVAQGAPDQVVNRYLQLESSTDGHYRRPAIPPNRAAAILSVELQNADGQVSGSADNGRALSIRIEYKLYDHAPDTLCPSISVRNAAGLPVFQHHARLTKQLFRHAPSHGYFILRIPRLPLPAANYYVSAALISDQQILDHVENALEFSVLDGNFYAPGESTPASHGLVLVDGDWSVTAETTMAGKREAQSAKPHSQ
jgi:lipopolysaccharide transport system ATP-binding protein